MKSKFVFVLSQDGNPLMPTKRLKKVRKLLANKLASIKSYNPFTIQLNISNKNYTQYMELGIDTGSSFIGFSAIDRKQEYIGGEVELRQDIKGLLETKAMNRRIRRNKLRFRKPRFDNRKRDKLNLKSGDEIIISKKYKNNTISVDIHDRFIFSHKEDNRYHISDFFGEYKGYLIKKVFNKVDKWLPPSIQHKKDVHEKIINRIVSCLPIKKIVIETANFDIQKIKNPEIKGKMYQEGEMKGFWNLREYILHRDKHQCQNPNCKNNDKYKILEVHHIIYRDNPKCTDNPNNLITLCIKCHTSANHKKGKFLYEWMTAKKPKINSFRPETFMNIIQKNFIYDLKTKYPDIEINSTYGYLTKNKRIEQKINKSHHNDAFVIAGGNNQERVETLKYNFVRRNDRELSKFEHAKYIDSRELYNINYDTDLLPLIEKENAIKIIDKLKLSPNIKYEILCSIFTKEAIKKFLKSSTELFNGRKTRNIKPSGENLKKYRKVILDVKKIDGKIIKKDGNDIYERKFKGNYKFSTKQYDIKNGTMVLITDDWSGKNTTVKKGEKFKAGGMGGKGKKVYIKINNKKNVIPSKICKILYHQKGLVPN